MCRGIQIPLSSSIFFITFFILLFSSNISIVSSFCNCSRYSSSFFLYFSSTFWVFRAIDSPKSSPLCFVIIVFLIKNINYSSSPYSFTNFSNSCNASGYASHSQHSSQSIQDLNDLPPQVSYSTFWAFFFILIFINTQKSYSCFDAQCFELFLCSVQILISSISMRRFDAQYFELFLYLFNLKVK